MLDVSKKLPFALLNKTAAFLCNCNPVDFSPLHSDERKRTYDNNGNLHTTHYEVKGNKLPNTHYEVKNNAQEEDDNQRRTFQQASGSSEETLQKEASKNDFRISEPVFNDDSHDDRPSFEFVDPFHDFDRVKTRNERDATIYRDHRPRHGNRYQPNKHNYRTFDDDYHDVRDAPSFPQKVVPNSDKHPKSNSLYHKGEPYSPHPADHSDYGPSTKFGVHSHTEFSRPHPEDIINKPIPNEGPNYRGPSPDYRNDYTPQDGVPQFDNSFYEKIAEAAVKKLNFNFGGGGKQKQSDEGKSLQNYDSPNPYHTLSQEDLNDYKSRSPNNYDNPHKFRATDYNDYDSHGPNRPNPGRNAYPTFETEITSKPIVKIYHHIHDIGPPPPSPPKHQRKQRQPYASHAHLYPGNREPPYQRRPHNSFYRDYDEAQSETYERFSGNSKRNVNNSKDDNDRYKNRPTSFFSIEKARKKPLNPGGDAYHKEETNGDITGIPSLYDAIARDKLKADGLPHHFRSTTLYGNRRKQQQTDGSKEYARENNRETASQSAKAPPGNLNTNNPQQQQGHLPQQPPPIRGGSPNTFNHLPQLAVPFNPFGGIGSTLRTIYNSLPTVNWRVRPMQVAPRPTLVGATPLVGAPPHVARNNFLARNPAL